MGIRKVLKRILCAQLFFFGCQMVFSQENYLTGNIVEINGDTVHGYIDYRKWDFNPENISFKENLSSNEIKYTPLDIKGFSVLNEKYESALVNIEISPMDISNLDNNPNPELESKVAFLQAIIQGRKSLYYYKNNERKEFFYIKNDSVYELLNYKKYLNDQNGKISENKRFIGQLTIYLNDCKEIQSNLNETEYQRWSLEKLFDAYNKYTNSEMKFNKVDVKVLFEKGALAGASLTSVKFYGESFPYLVNGNFNQPINFTAGLFLDVIVPGTHKKWSLNNELMFSSYSISGSYNNTVTQITTNSTLGFSYIKMNNMIRFRFPVGGVFVYFNVGLANGLIVSETNKMQLVSTYRTLDYKAINETRKWENGFITGAGVKYKKYSFEIRYEKGNGMSTIEPLRSTVNRFTLTLGYRFK
jgi:hypothetical protein